MQPVSWQCFGFTMEGTKMTLHPVTINLPDKVLHRLQQAATTLQRPLEEMIEQTIQANLPPLIEDLPPSLQAEAASLQQADDQSLWHIVQEALPGEQWERHTELLSRQREGVLSKAEERELAQLREAVDRFVLRRSFVLALLKWRGHSLPLAPIKAN
jgi:predicted transcriptional regulator